MKPLDRSEQQWQRPVSLGGSPINEVEQAVQGVA
jgi:hypothetical protein